MGLFWLYPRIRCSSISERYPDPDAWHRIRMFGRISPDVGRERFFEEWPETRSKQAFYREYSQYKVKYLLFWPYSSKNHSHSSKNRYRSFEHVSRRNGRIRVFGQNDPKRVNSSKKRPKTPVFGPYPAETGQIHGVLGLFQHCFSHVRSRPTFDRNMQKGGAHPDPNIAPKCSNNGSGDTAKTGRKPR